MGHDWNDDCWMVNQKMEEKKIRLVEGTFWSGDWIGKERRVASGSAGPDRDDRPYSRAKGLLIENR